MGHSHIPVAHLVKQVELRRSQRSGRDRRPLAITEFINQVAELFDPSSELARVGFDCRWDEERWHIGMYLGSTEIVGGRNDGKSRHTGFEFDVHTLQELFAHLERLYWSARPQEGDDAEVPAGSVLTVDGILDVREGEEGSVRNVEGTRIRLQVFSVAPASAGPGLREYSDGRRDLV